jgi:hypothetical protein
LELNSRSPEFLARSLIHGAAWGVFLSLSPSMDPVSVCGSHTNNGRAIENLPYSGQSSVMCQSADHSYGGDYLSRRFPHHMSERLFNFPTKGKLGSPIFSSGLQGLWDFQGFAAPSQNSRMVPWCAALQCAPNINP